MRGSLADTKKISFDQVELEGELIIPSHAEGIVLFAHGSASSRFSPRNQFVAKFFRERHLATLLVDLLTEEEEKIDEKTSEYRFNIELLADRLVAVTEWILQNPETKKLEIGYFGSSTGAAAALIAAAKMSKAISAIVSRGGRADLAASYLHKVNAPTLLIVGGADGVVVELNKQAFQQLRTVKKLEIIPRATHLFEEEGALEAVADLAFQWFFKFLCNG